MSNQKASTPKPWGLIWIASGSRTPGQELGRRLYAITIFLCGDVTTGRGIDQILPHPSDPTIYEPYVKSAQGYVKIAEEVNGAIDFPVSFPYVWGIALKEMDRVVDNLFFTVDNMKGVNQICNEILKTANPLYIKLSLPSRSASLRRLFQIK
jgi:poly-gamma-glutamate capsule biosynthesis protein CapA/YwtB (metallophosphatase superfamily)